MRACIQRVKEASVQVDGKVVGKIGPGLLVLFGVRQGDSVDQIPWMASKILNLRIFRDEEGKMNRSVQEVGGEILVVSQFTLYGDCSKGRRPSFVEAMNGPEAEDLYNQFVKQLGPVQTGVFGASMEVQLTNDGPVTLLVEQNP